MFASRTLDACKPLQLVLPAPIPIRKQLLEPNTLTIAMKRNRHATDKEKPETPRRQTPHTLAHPCCERQMFVT